VSGGAAVGAGVGAGVGSLAGSLVGAWVVSALDSLEPVASLAHAAIAPMAISTVKIRRTPRG
jgi:phage tail tape-measure protein